MGRMIDRNIGQEQPANFWINFPLFSIQWCFPTLLGRHRACKTGRMLSTEMNVIEYEGFGSPEVLHMCQRPLPQPGSNEVLIKVTAAGVNRADILQRKGKYPPPPGASDILGMEISGVIAALGAQTTRWIIGQRVCALLISGGYGEYVAVDERLCLPVPEKISMLEAAGLMEALATVYANIFESAGLRSGETVLVHGGSSGIGHIAIQMIKQFGASVLVTVANAEKAEFCHKLGADFTAIYTQEDFVETAQKATAGRGVDIVLDMIGGDYLNRNLTALGFKGRHVSIATQHGAKAEIDMRLVMQKQLTLTGSTLRGRSLAEKARLIAEIGEKMGPSVAAGRIKPFIYQSFPLKNAAEAHKMMESGAHMGKIVLEVS